MSKSGSDYSMQVFASLYKSSKHFKETGSACLPCLRIPSAFWDEILKFASESVPDGWEAKMGPLRGVITIQPETKRDPVMRDVA